MSILHVVSVSGGKDSAATAILALETMPRESLRFIFCDTGNEHESTYDWLDYMAGHLGITITTLRAEFSAQMARQREYILSEWPKEGISEADCQRAAAAMIPTGNPFLDLCVWKGRFPSRRAQFCTEQLKTLPATEHQLGYIDRGECEAVWSWQGVRIDESISRRTRLACPANLAFSKFFDVRGGGIFNYRPILRWGNADVFEAHRIVGLEPNPLYRLGMSRVGCMPCINAGKDEVLAISRRFPGDIERIAMWELAVKASSKRGDASFFPDPNDQAHLNMRGIENIVSWAKTARGGRQFDIFRVYDEPKACESAYGLCE